MLISLKISKCFLLSLSLFKYVIIIYYIEINDIIGDKTLE